MPSQAMSTSHPGPKSGNFLLWSLRLDSRELGLWAVWRNGGTGASQAVFILHSCLSTLGREARVLLWEGQRAASPAGLRGRLGPLPS